MRAGVKIPTRMVSLQSPHLFILLFGMVSEYLGTHGMEIFGNSDGTLALCQVDGFFHISSKSQRDGIEYRNLAQL